MTSPQVAAAVKLPVDEVELLVMKAISLNLVRGSIDECDKVKKALLSCYLASVTVTLFVMCSAH